MAIGWKAALAAGTAALLAGCAQVQQPAVSAAQVESFVASYPPELRRLYAQVPIQGQRNLALNHMRAGLAALEANRTDDAAASFDQVLRIIEAVYADSPEAARARSVWYKESTKDFKGEPYERAMAYYYRGLIYLMAGDYQNARASFRGGLLQDTFMEEDQRMASDFAALAFLEGWAARCAGFDRTTIEASFREAAGKNGALAEPPPAETILVLFETGSAPLKRQAGRRREVLTYAPGSLPPVSSAELRFGAREGTATQAENIFFQASTRQGRVVDQVNQGKVQYQDTTRTAGQAATVAGAGMVAASRFTNNNNAAAAMGAAGAAVMLVGLLAQAAAESMETEADARQWDNLPGNILLGTLAQPQAARGQEPPSEVAVRFARGGMPDTRSLAVRGSGACRVAWGRELPASRVPDVAPFSRPGK